MKDRPSKKTHTAPEEEEYAAEQKPNGLQDEKKPQADTKWTQEDFRRLSEQELRTLADEVLNVSQDAPKQLAYAELMDRCIGWIYSFIREEAKGEALQKADTEDLVHSFFDGHIQGALLTYKNKSGSTFQKWLFTVWRNFKTDYYRKQIGRRKQLNSRNKTFASEINIGPPEAWEQAAEKLLGDHQDEKAKLLNAAIDSLKPENREPILLYYFENKPIKEIASELGIKESATKVRLYRARVKLHKKLAPLTKKDA